MSLERRYAKAVRKIKKRDADLAAKGTTAGKEELKKQERKEAASSLSRAQQTAAKSDNSKNGYQPESSEGAWCRTCGQRYTGSVNAHWETH